MTDKRDSEENIGYAPLPDQRTRKRKSKNDGKKPVWTPEDIHTAGAWDLKDDEVSEEYPSIDLTENYKDPISEKIRSTKVPANSHGADIAQIVTDDEWDKNTRDAVAQNDPLSIPVEERASPARVFSGGLTIKQERFCQEYVANSGNATAAYISVYGKGNNTPKTLNETACKLLKNPKVITRVDEVLRDALKATQVTADRVIAEYAKLAFSNMGDYLNFTADGMVNVDLSDLDHDKKAAIQEVKVDRVRTLTDEDGEPTGHVERITFKLADKRAALGDLAKYLNMFKERHEIGVSSDLVDLMAALDGMTPRIPTAAPSKAVTEQPRGSHDASTLVENEDGVWEESDLDAACDELFGE